MKNPSEVKTIAICGTGTIGGGLAAYFALKGLNVNAFDIALERAEGNVRAVIDTYAKYGIAQCSDDIWSRICFTSDPAEAFTGAVFVQENGAEDLTKKHEMIAVMERYLPDDAVIASSSSGMPATLIAEGARHPQRIIVAHPFHPAYLIPLMEICRGEQTEQRYVDWAAAFYRRFDKIPIVLQKEKPGFVANRLAHALWREEMALVCEGVCSLADADNAVCYGPGLRWGIMGPALGYELGAGEMGIAAAFQKFGTASNAIYEDLSALTATPDEFISMASGQMSDLMAALPEYVGHDHNSIAEFRDRMLIEMLRMHKKCNGTSRR